MLFDDATVEEMMTTWPTKPTVYQVPPDSVLPNIVNAKLLNTYIDTGCAPGDEVNVIKDGAARHPRGYTTAGKLDPSKVTMWRGRGFSFQLRNLDRWYPPLHAMCRTIQQETGFGCYVSAFLTPGGTQGLDYHWDQNMAIVYQASGRKTWQIWHPVVEEPHRAYKASNRTPIGDQIERWKTKGPDEEIVLKPGQVLVLPRGWAHNPHAFDLPEESVHLTFVVRERTGFWISEKLTQAAIESLPLRQVIAPGRIVDEDALTEEVETARDNLIAWLSETDAKGLASELLGVAKSELEPDYV
ncbi:JmjC domain-containing protein [Actinoplanes sp. NPDC049668]|uniref:JmjC domain-containing protein n=1 Tax=unclassified Actinoplanes TaxID=2626549 RepID=UPI0033B61976